MSKQRLAIDIGGTFVDFALFDEATGQLNVEKELSSETNLTAHILRGMERLGVRTAELDMIVHGSTVVINTILQEKGARIGLITTEGFRDVLELGRGNRPEVYNLLYKPAPPLVPRYLRFEVPERVDHRGRVVRRLDAEAVRQTVGKLKERGVEGIAVCFLHAYANPRHERQVREIVLQEWPDAPVAISSDLTREFREFERTSTTVLNVYVMPRVATYLEGLEQRLAEKGYRGSLNVIQTTGGMMSSAAARQLPIRTLESGPAAGVIGSLALGRRLGSRNLIAADVGGTSFDVALIVEGRPFEKARTEVNRRPVLQPTIDIVSVGAGGGSIASVSAEGVLQVGPRSAEADPGPVCFGKGATEPTVTDAHLALGRINPDFFLGRRMPMHLDLAEQAIMEKIGKPLGLGLQQAASGITRLADTNMINAIRQVSVERGHDPRDFSLLCYGGGGGLFAGALARELRIPRALIPLNPAVFSAWGILNADFREDVAQTSVRKTAQTSADELRAMLAQLKKLSLANLRRNGVSTEGVRCVRLADMRYSGQEHTVAVPIPGDDQLEEKGLALLGERFDALHERAYAHASPGAPTEIVSLRISAVRETSKPCLAEIPVASGSVERALQGRRRVYFSESESEVECPIYRRDKLGAGDRLHGPAIVEEWSSTIPVLPGQELEVDRYGTLLLHVV